MRVFLPIFRRFALALPSLLFFAAAQAAGAAKAEPGVPAASILQTIFGLAVILALLGAFAWFVKRSAGGNLAGRTGALRILGALPLGPKERIVLLEAGSQCLVVGLAPGCIRTLHVFPKSELPGGDAPAVAAAVPFSAWLSRFAKAPNKP